MKSVALIAILVSSMLAFLFTCNKTHDLKLETDTMNKYDSIIIEADALMCKIDSISAKLDSIIARREPLKNQNKIIIIPPDRPYEY